MPRVNRNTAATLRLPCDEAGDTFTVTYTNMGEPFREGVRIGVANEDFSKELTVMLENRESAQLRDVLLEHFPLKKWVSVKDRLPKGDRQVLVHTNFGDTFTCRLPVILSKNERMSTKESKYENVTHWMEMPSKPVT